VRQGCGLSPLSMRARMPISGEGAWSEEEGKRLNCCTLFGLRISSIVDIVIKHAPFLTGVFL
jgi:hypothetical protein